MTLYAIEASLEQLAQIRSETEAEGDSQAIDAIDQQIREYLYTREPAKVDSYAWAIRKEEDIADLCWREAARLKELAERAEANAQRMRDNVIFVMQKFNVKELRTPTNTMRVQANGGLQKVEVTDLAMVPSEYQIATVTLPFDLWGRICAEMDRGLLARCCSELKKEERSEDTGRIREALKRRVPCPECGGSGVYRRRVADADVVDEKCEHCEGKGTVPATVPGAKLLNRGVHLRLE